MVRFTGILITILALILTACRGAAPAQPSIEVKGQTVFVQGGSYTDVSPEELQAMLAKKDFTFLNVHTPFAGSIGKTDLAIPYDQIDQNLNKLPADKNAKIVLYCRSGRMSSLAAKTLVGLGYTNIWELVGGMAAWEQAGFEINR